MKKIYAFAIVLAATAMVACGGNATTKSAEAEAEVEATEQTECCGECAEGECTCSEEQCEGCEGCAENAEAAEATEAAAE